MSTAYLDAYLAVPADVRQKIASPDAVARLAELEKRHNLDLATVAIRVVVGDIPFGDLEKKIQQEFKLPQVRAKMIAEDLKKNYFAPVLSYIEKLAPPVSTPTPVASPPVAPVTSSASAFESDSQRAIVDEIMKAIPVGDLSAELRQRLENAIRLRVKDVRDTVDTRDFLRKSVDTGGMGFSDDTVDLVIQTILSATTGGRLKPASLPKIAMAEQAASSVAPAAPTVPLATPPVPTATAESKEEPIAEIPPPPAVTPPPSFTPAPVLSQNPAPTAAPTPSPTFAVPSSVQQNFSDHKASMVDVRSRPEVLGPIDELRLFSLIDFRRLDPNPSIATARLREKIKLLEDESYDKMVEGVRAWRTSPLNALYVGLGQESLTSGTSVAALLQQRKAAGQNALTEAEFDAIMELNRNLRF